MNLTMRNELGILTLMFLITGAALYADDNAQTPAENSAPAANEEIGKLLKDVTEGGFAERTAATTRLVELGEPAVAPLSKAAETDQEDVATRCFDVLGRLLASTDEKTSAAAEKSLDQLSESDIRFVAVRAKTMLRLKQVLRQREALLRQGAIPAAPRAAAGPLKMETTTNGKSIRLERAADGSFTGRIKETVDGKDQESEIKAASEKELKEKFPEAHQAWQQQQKQLDQARNAPFAPPAQGFFFGGFGGGGGPGGGQNIQVQINNGQRHVQVQNGDEKVEIRDTNGKEIELKHTHTVDGKSKTDEYKAADLDDLRKKHPDAAKLYEKHTGGNNANVIIGGGGVGGVQVQIRAVAGPFQGPIPGGGLIPTPPANSSPGPRTIRADQDGRKIEITDEDGRKIHIKLTKTLDGKEVSQEFSADDLKTLATEHPEAAKLYEQLTGKKAD
jgi:hypothetical protein